MAVTRFWTVTSESKPMEKMEEPEKLRVGSASQVMRTGTSGCCSRMVLTGLMVLTMSLMMKSTWSISRSFLVAVTALVGFRAVSSKMTSMLEFGF